MDTITKYKKYIDKYYPDFKSTYGKCQSACQSMQKEFPELNIIKGVVQTMGWGERQHWWLEAPDGSIVDPTAKQFPGILNYEEFQPGMELRVGRCMNCGNDIYKKVYDLTDVEQQCVCSKECEEILIREIS